MEDLARTAEFYEAIGFRRGKEEADRLTFYVNWFFVTFIAQDREGADLPVRGAGVFTYVRLDDVDAQQGGGRKGPEARERAAGNARRSARVRFARPGGLRACVFDKK